MSLSHYSSKPVQALEPREYQQNVGPFGNWRLKPQGLWVSVDGTDDWPTTCSKILGKRAYPVIGLRQFCKFRHRVRLAPDSRILWLRSEADVFDFCARFALSDEREQMWSEGKATVVCTGMIDWTKVAAEYSGLIVAPYHARLRYRLMWYYALDCASGCIWDLSAISEFGPPEAFEDPAVD